MFTYVHARQRMAQERPRQRARRTIEILVRLRFRNHTTLVRSMRPVQAPALAMPQEDLT